MQSSFKACSSRSRILRWYGCRSSSLKLLCLLVELLFDALNPDVSMNVFIVFTIFLRTLFWNLCNILIRLGLTQFQSLQLWVYISFNVHIFTFSTAAKHFLVFEVQFCYFFVYAIFPLQFYIQVVHNISENFILKFL